MYEPNIIERDVFMNKLSDMFPERSFTDLQKEFYDFCLKTIEEDTNTDVVTVIPGICGIGKSTFIATYLRSSLDKSNYGMMIVSDKIDLLYKTKHYSTDGVNMRSEDPFDESEIDKDSRIGILTSDTKETEIVRQKYRPILLMTKQRYFSMDAEQLKTFLYFKINGENKKRKLIIIDEQPDFYNIHSLGINELNDIATGLELGIDDTCDRETKKWITSKYGALSSSLQQELETCEYIRNKNTYAWYDHVSNSITEDDGKFFDIIKKYEKSIKKHKRDAIRNLYNCYLLLENGALTVTTKSRDKDGYDKYFMVIKDNRDHFLLDKDVKVIVFDGTADVSASYSEFCDYVNVVDTSMFRPDMSHVSIHLIHCNTSRNAIISKDSDGAIKKTIVQYIQKKNLPIDDTLFVTYKYLVNDTNCFDDIEFEKGYFGGLKGLNDYRYKHNYVQVGLNRQRDINYLAMMLYDQPEYIYYLRNKDREEQISFIDETLSDFMIKDIIIQEVAADTIQNIYRTAIRDINSKEPINIFLFYDTKTYKDLKLDLTDVFGRQGARIKEEKIPELLKKKIYDRESNSVKGSLAQRVMSWIDSLPNGTTFTTSDICKNLGIKTKQLQTAKDFNKGFKTLLQSMFIKRGVYRKT